MPFPVSAFIYLEHVPRSGVAGSDGSSFSNFLMNSILFFIMAIPIYISPSSVQDSFPPLPHQHGLIACLFYDNRSNRHEMISHCGFDLCFSCV